MSIIPGSPNPSSGAGGLDFFAPAETLDLMGNPTNNGQSQANSVGLTPPNTIASQQTTGLGLPPGDSDAAKMNQLTPYGKTVAQTIKDINGELAQDSHVPGGLDNAARQALMGVNTPGPMSPTQISQLQHLDDAMYRVESDERTKDSGKALVGMGAAMAAVNAGGGLSGMGFIRGMDDPNGQGSPDQTPAAAQQMAKAAQADRNAEFAQSIARNSAGA